MQDSGMRRRLFQIDFFTKVSTILPFVTEMIKIIKTPSRTISNAYR